MTPGTRLLTVELNVHVLVLGAELQACDIFEAHQSAARHGFDDDVFELVHILKSAKNLRVWGTTKGLGELVNGPLSGTKLDQVGTVRVPSRALIHLIDVEQKKWNSL